MDVGIKGIGMAVPDKILCNADLEKMVDTTDEWITTRTGIKERHIIEKDEKITDLVAKAALMACRNGNLAPEALDFIISSTLIPDHLCPAESFEVARELKSQNAFCFDFNAACSGFIYGLGVGESLLKNRNISNGLVTAGEQISRTVDYTDRASCVLFGDGASAALLTNDNPEHLLVYTELGSDPSMANEVVIGGVNDLLNDRKANYYFRQNGKAIFRFAVNKIKELYETVPEKAGIKPDDIRYIIPHQANIRIIEAAASNIHSGNTEVLANIERYGNTSSASIGLVMAENWSRFQRGDFIMLIGFGGGLSWGATIIRW